MSVERVARAAERGHHSAAGIVSDGEACWIAGFSSEQDRARPWLARIEDDALAWERRYGDTEGFVRSIVRAADDSLVIAGERALPDVRAYRAWVGCVSNSGDERWQLSEGRAGPTLLKSLTVRQGGGVVAAGNEHDDALVLAVDAGGTLVWKSTPADISRITGVASCGDSYVAVGSRGQTANQMGTPLAIAVDGSGAETWRVDLGDGAQGELLAVTQLAGDVVAVGRKTNQRGRPDAWIVRLSAAGELVWEQFLPEMAVAAAIVATGDELVVAGTILPRATARIARIDGGGKQIWHIDGDVNGERLAAIDIAANGMIVAAGTASSPGENSHALVLRSDGTSIVRTLIPAVPQ